MGIGQLLVRFPTILTIFWLTKSAASSRNMDLKSEDSSSQGGGSSGYLADISNTSSYFVPVFSIFDDGYDADRESFDSGDVDSAPYSGSSEGDSSTDIDTRSGSSEGDNSGSDVNESSESLSREIDNVGSNKFETLEADLLVSYSLTPRSIIGIMSSIRRYFYGTVEQININYCGNCHGIGGFDILKFRVYVRRRQPVYYPITRDYTLELLSVDSDLIDTPTIIKGRLSLFKSSFFANVWRSSWNEYVITLHALTLYQCVWNFLPAYTVNSTSPLGIRH